MYSIIAGIVGAIFILIASVLHLLWNGKTLRNTTAWRTKLERTMEHGTHELVDDWESHGLTFPISARNVEAELARTREYENKLQRCRKRVIVALYVGGTLFAIIAILLAVGT